MASFIDTYSKNKGAEFPGIFSERPYDALEILANQGMPIAKYLDLDFSGLRNDGFIIDSLGIAVSKDKSLENISLPGNQDEIKSIYPEEEMQYLLNNTKAYKNGRLNEPLIEHLNKESANGMSFAGDLISQVKSYYQALTGKNIQTKELKEFSKESKSYLITNS